MIGAFVHWFADHAVAFGLLHVLLAGLGLLGLWFKDSLDATLVASRVVLAVLLAAPGILLFGKALLPEAALISTPSSVVDTEMVAVNGLPMSGSVGSVASGEAMSPSIDWKRVLVSVWIVGALLAFCRFAADVLKLHRHLRRLPEMSSTEVARVGSKVADQFRTDSTASGPYSVGLVKRFLVFPPSLVGETATSSLRCMVRHEDCHLRHRDSIDTFLWQFLRAWYWWSPLVHLLGKRVHELQEWRADSESVGSDPHQACALSRILIDQASLTRSRPLVQLMAACSARALKRRVQRLLIDSRQPDHSTGLVRVLWIGLLLAVVGTHVACTGLLPSTVNVEKEGPIGGVNASAKEEAEVIVEIEKRLNKVKNAANTDDLVAVEMKFFETAAGESAADGIKFEGREDPVVSPQTTILRPEEVERLVKTQTKDPSSTQVSYPRVLTANKRLVTIRSVVNEPVRTVPDPETGESSMEYLPIGTVINAAPVILKSGEIHCDFNLTISSLIGERIIGGMRYPIASSRIYSAPLVVKSGHTVYIRGLDEAMSEGSADAKLLSVLVTVTRIPKAEAGVEF